MAKKGKMAGDGSSKKRSISARRNSSAKPGLGVSVRDELNFLFETQELKKKKESKRSLKPKSRLRKSIPSAKGNKNATKKGNDFTASETLSKKSREKVKQLPEQELSEDEKPHSVSQIRNAMKPSSSKRVIPSRPRQFKRLSIPAGISPSSSLASLSQGSDYNPESSFSQSCSSVSSWASDSANAQKDRSKHNYQTAKLAKPSTSGQTGRPTFKRRNSPHPRLIKAKRAKIQNCMKRSRSASTASSASKISNSSQQLMKQRCSRPTNGGAKLKKTSTDLQNESNDR